MVCNISAKVSFFIWLCNLQNIALMKSDAVHLQKHNGVLTWKQLDHCITKQDFIS